MRSRRLMIKGVEYKVTLGISHLPKVIFNNAMNIDGIICYIIDNKHNIKSLGLLLSLTKEMFCEKKSPRNGIIKKLKTNKCVSLLTKIRKSKQKRK